jgi:hypothetical protein
MPPRSPAKWRLTFLSAGEVGLEYKIGERGKKAKAGPSVHLIEVPADAGGGYKLFIISMAFRVATPSHDTRATPPTRHRGRAGKLFLEHVAAMDRAVLVKATKMATANWMDVNLPAEADGQMSRGAGRFDVERDRPLSDTLQIVVIQPGDVTPAIHKAVGFPITWDQAEQPGFEWMEDHGAWFELGYVLTDDFGMLVFIADHPGTNSTLRFNCLMLANRPVVDENK